MLNSKQQILFLGGDNRQKYVKEFISSSDIVNSNYQIEDQIFTSIEYESDILELVKHSHILIAPIPLPKTHTEIILPCITIPFQKIIENLNENTIVFAGGLSNELTQLMYLKKIIYFDCLKNESVQIKNAIATAEGTIMKAIEKSNINIHSSNCLVTGFGKCGKVLADMLSGLKANVTVCARSDKNLSEALVNGYKGVPLNNLHMCINEYDFIFNTIPALVINDTAINNISPDTVIIDIASVPGGINFEYAKNKGLSLIHYLSIPGKVAPKTSGHILGEYILNTILTTI